MNNSQDIFYLSPENELLSSQPEGAQAATPPSVVAADAGSSLSADLTAMVGLIANVTESYSAVIFLANEEQRTLRVAAAHTLSREFIDDAEIRYGCGLVGWTAENKARISVCPFEHDARTLLYYQVDQQLKSFICMPVLSPEGSLLGVIACDSKKSYAFAKVKEKLLQDCARQIVSLVKLHDAQNEQPESPEIAATDLYQYLEKIRSAGSEKELFATIVAMPEEVLFYEALVLVASGKAGGVYYSGNTEDARGHRLLQFICERQKVLSGERVMHSLPVDDSMHRSFLAVPFHALGKEAGSFNLLSQTDRTFTTAEIKVLEQIAQAVGRELERLRLLAMYQAGAVSEGFVTWGLFARLGQERLEASSAPHTLLRVRFVDSDELERKLGISGMETYVARISRLIEQVKRSETLACKVYGNEFLILTPSTEGQLFVTRLTKLIEKLTPGELGSQVTLAASALGGDLLEQLDIASAQSGPDGDTLSELVAATLPEEVKITTKSTLEVPNHARYRA